MIAFSFAEVFNQRFVQKMSKLKCPPLKNLYPDISTLKNLSIGLGIGYIPKPTPRPNTDKIIYKTCIQINQTGIQIYRSKNGMFVYPKIFF